MSKKKINYNIDIIIPNFNKGRFLEEAIRSVINQSYKNWKLYIVDDNSNDNSKIILNKYLKNKKINVFFLKKNRGPSYCRNYAIKKSNSNFIAFLDSDDFWTNKKLFEQITFMKKNNYSLTYSDYISFYQIKDKIKIIGKTNIRNNFNFESFIKDSSMNTSTLILKRTLINYVKFRNLKKLEDYIFKCDIFKKNKKIFAYKLQRHSAYYRIIKNARSSSKVKNLFYLWKYNYQFNKLSFLKNLKSIVLISLNSIKKYGLKMGV